MGTADEESGRQSMSTIFRKVLKTTWVLINVLVLIALPLCAWDMYKHNMAGPPYYGPCDTETHYIAWFVGGVFVLLALPITFYEARFVRPRPRAPGRRPPPAFNGDI